MTPKKNEFQGFLPIEKENYSSNIFTCFGVGSDENFEIACIKNYKIGFWYRITGFDNEYTLNLKNNNKHYTTKEIKIKYLPGALLWVLKYQKVLEVIVEYRNLQNGSIWLFSAYLLLYQRLFINLFI